MPPVIKQVFATFPLQTYPSNTLPTRSPSHRDEHTLYIWTTPNDAKTAQPSFNPTCLKWQTYLKLHNIPFRTRPSNNHASPSGSLPFLLPANTSSPVASSKLEAWTQKNGKTKIADTTSPLRQDIYTSLLDHAIRRAWLYLLYLQPENFPLAQDLYITPSSNHPLINLTVSHQLRQAAAQELLKTTPKVQAEQVLAEAVDAFAALSTLLGEDEWFFGGKEPGLFDAEVFAYTYLLGSGVLEWRENKMGEELKRFENLGRHRERIVGSCYKR